jgi:hypothetical protein
VGFTLSGWQNLSGARRLTDDEGRRLQQIVRRGTGSPIRLRRAMVIMASASGNTVPAIARLVQGDRMHGVRQFHACYSIGDDTLWGVVRRRKSAGNTLAALKSIRAARPDGAPIYVILDNLSAHKGKTIRAWAVRHRAGGRTGAGRTVAPIRTCRTGVVEARGWVFSASSNAPPAARPPWQVR